MIVKDLSHSYFEHIDYFRDRLSYWKAEGFRIVFTNGCFDLIHPGHIYSLIEAKKRGDKLVVGLNSDQSIKKLKGSSRPIQTESSRACVLAAIKFVDVVILFQEETPEALLKVIKPDIWVKGGDYLKEQLSGKDIVESYGGEIQIIERLSEQSSSFLIEKILSKKDNETA